MSWRELWKQFWCKHHWHRKDHGDHLQVIEPKRCKIIPRTHYWWTCCKCELRVTVPFSSDPNSKTTGGPI